MQTVTLTAEHIAALEASFTVPFPTSERQRLGADGYTIHNPSAEPCLIPVADWRPDSFIATKGREAVISVVWAWREQTGAWKRLVSRLRANGYSIKVIEPSSIGMVKALQRTGFHGPYQHGTTFFDRYEYWESP